MCTLTNTQTGKKIEKEFHGPLATFSTVQALVTNQLIGDQVTNHLIGDQSPEWRQCNKRTLVNCLRIHQHVSEWRMQRLANCPCNLHLCADVSQLRGHPSMCRHEGHNSTTPSSGGGRLARTAKPLAYPPARANQVILRSDFDYPLDAVLFYPSTRVEVYVLF